MAFRSANPPEYPRDELNSGIEGTTLMLVLADETGHPAAVAIEYSSGNRQLDLAAVNAAYRWKFHAGKTNGNPVAGIVRVPVSFAISKQVPPRKDLPGGDDEFKQTDTRKVAEIEEKATKGNGDAAYLFGQMCKYGLGIRKDTAKAAEWFHKAAERYQTNATHGNPYTEYHLARMYFDGTDAARDVPMAIRLLENAASYGQVDAQNDLGWILAQGNGVPKDSAKAMDWYRKAAVQGDVSAFANIGWMYEHGEGVERDDVMAYAWYTLATTHGLKALASVSRFELATKARSALEKSLSQEQLREANRLSSSWAKGKLLSRESE
jgi:TonB family protein